MKVEGVGFGFGVVVDEALPRWRASGGIKELGKGICGWEEYWWWNVGLCLDSLLCKSGGRMLGFWDFYGGKFSVLWLSINQNARVELAEEPILVGKISGGGMLGFKHF